MALRSVSASARMRYIDVFIPKLSPTIISPWRTMIISYSWMILVKKDSSGCR